MINPKDPFFLVEHTIIKDVNKIFTEKEYNKYYNKLCNKEDFIAANCSRIGKNKILVKNLLYFDDEITRFFNEKYKD